MCTIEREREKETWYNRFDSKVGILYLPHLLWYFFMNIFDLSWTLYKTRYGEECIDI